jgi:hypothetical protein
MLDNSPLPIGLQLTALDPNPRKLPDTCHERRLVIGDLPPVSVGSRLPPDIAGRLAWRLSSNGVRSRVAWF